jgi:hypothetical protein
MVAQEWIRRSMWALRSPEFGELGSAFVQSHMMGEWRRERVVTMQYAKTGSACVRVAEPLWRLWQDLPRHPVLFEVLEPGILRYAAIDWTQPRIALGVRPADDLRIAAWGIELAQTMELVLSRVPAAQAAWFTSPIVKIDLEGQLRVGFASVGRDSLPSDCAPPELHLQWPLCTERSFVYAVGRGLWQLIRDFQPNDPFGAVILRCLERDPTKRFRSLDEVIRAFSVLGARPRVRAMVRAPRHVWNELEQGIGFRELGDPREANERFDYALRLDPGSHVVRDLRSVDDRSSRPALQVQHR